MSRGLFAYLFRGDLQDPCPSRDRTAAKRRRIRFVAATTLLGAALISDPHWRAGAETGAQGGNARTGAQPYRDNERIVTKPDGTRIVLIRWAIGSRDNIVMLEIPVAYVPLVGAAPLGPHYSDPNYQQPFLTAKVFDAMLWDMRPLTRERKLAREQENMVVFGMIESIYAGSRERNEAEQLQMIAQIRLEGIRRNYYQSRYGLQIVEKPGRFGLRRIGAVHVLGEQTPVGLKEFYYDGGEQPEAAGNFISCTDDAVPDDPPPGKFANPGCEQWFALPELSATVKVTYRRRHLAEWRELKRRVSELLLAWRPSDVGRQR
jgi:hypothetical protein